MSGALPPKLPAPLMLPAAMELACSAHASVPSARSLAEVVRDWASADDRLSAAMEALETHELQDARYGAREREVARVRSATSASLFSNRFSQTLVDIAGMPKDRASALAGALSEMIDNVMQHSTSEEGQPGVALQGYEVGATGYSFAIIDIGLGALASLQRSSRWSNLKNDSEALDAIVLKGASRRPDAERGGGFSTVVRAMADQGRLVFQTGDSYVSVAKSGNWGPRIGGKGGRYPLTGCAVSVSGPA